MAGLQEPSKRQTDRSDTAATGSSSDSSMEDVGSSSITDPTSTGKSADSEATRARPGTSSGHGRKRKVPESVTPNACTNCKKARAKCDGAKPSCKRCVNRNTTNDCRYEIHAKTAKEQMIREIRRLQEKNENLELERDTLDEKVGYIEQIMRSLKDNKQGSEIIRRLKRGESHKDIAEWLGRPLVGPANAPALSPTTECSISEVIEQYHQELVDNRDSRYWTNVTQDVQLIEHLVTLYFTWIHPMHMVMNEEHFISSFRQCSDVYCSFALVSAICAMSCHLLHHINSDDDQMRAAVDLLRNRFMDETRNVMKDVNDQKTTTVQTHAIMYLEEFASGHGLIASSHLRFAVESLLAKEEFEQSGGSESVTTLGIMSLHTAWSGFTYQKPLAPVSTHSYPFPEPNDPYGSQTWRLYKQPGDSSMQERLSYSAVTAAEQAKLFRIVHETVLIYCGSRGKVNALHLLDVYESYLMWRDALHPEIRYTDNKPLPHVIFLHVQYHTVLVQLFQPMLHLGNLDRQSYEQLQRLVVEHGKLGIQLLHQYGNDYSNCYMSPLQLLCLVQLCDTVIRYDDVGDTTPQTIQFCLSALAEGMGSYPVAGRLAQMFRHSLAEYNLSIPKEFESLIDKLGEYDSDELLDTCTRLTYRQPIAQILLNMQDNTAQEFIARWQHRSSKWAASEGRSRASSALSGNGKRMEIGSLLNP